MEGIPGVHLTGEFTEGEMEEEMMNELDGEERVSEMPTISAEEEKRDRLKFIPPL